MVKKCILLLELHKVYVLLIRIVCLDVFVDTQISAIIIAGVVKFGMKMPEFARHIKFVSNEVLPRSPPPQMNNLIFQFDL